MNPYKIKIRECVRTSSLMELELEPYSPAIITIRRGSKTETPECDEKSFKVVFARSCRCMEC